ncbi:MAG: hypothetical protein MJ160_05155 [Treponema sp.]|nr:hypothetical protein [Treponema sp.]
MKRILLLTAMLISICTAYAQDAYNPPVNGENFFELSSARLMTNAASSTGGGIFYANPSSLSVNPALTANEQRIAFNAGFTGLFSANPSDSPKIGAAFQLGSVVPFKWAVFTALINGTMCSFEDMNINDSMNLKLGLSKSITDNLYVGLGLDSGFFWGAGTDWSLYGNLGFLYKYGKLGFMDDFRIGGSIMNLGKTYTQTSSKPMISGFDVSPYPSLLMIKAGVSGLLLNKDSVKIGFSADVSTPMFHTVIFDAGLQCSIKNMFYISVAEKFNLEEFAQGHDSFIPAIGIGLKFRFGFENNEYMESKGWAESEMSTVVAYKELFNSVHAISTEVDLNLGTKDETPPVITLWFGDEGDD